MEHPATPFDLRSQGSAPKQPNRPLRQTYGPWSGFVERAYPASRRRAAAQRLSKARLAAALMKRALM